MKYIYIYIYKVFVLCFKKSYLYVKIIFRFSNISTSLVLYIISFYIYIYIYSIDYLFLLFYLFYNLSCIYDIYIITTTIPLKKSVEIGRNLLNNRFIPLSHHCPPKSKKVPKRDLKIYKLIFGSKINNFCVCHMYYLYTKTTFDPI